MAKMNWFRVRTENLEARHGVERTRECAEEFFSHTSGTLSTDLSCDTKRLNATAASRPREVRSEWAREQMFRTLKECGFLK